MSITESDPKLPVGSNFSHCSACGEYFLSVKAFEWHRQGKHHLEGDRRCTQTPHMDGEGLVRDPRGYWRLPKRDFGKRAQDLADVA